MTKDEATKLAKRCIPIIRKETLTFVKRHGAPPALYVGRISTHQLMVALNIQTSNWGARSHVVQALNAALNEAVELGLISNSRFGGGPVWTYTGPEVAKAVKASRQATKDHNKSVQAALKKLGLKGKLRHRHFDDGYARVTVTSLLKAAAKAKR